jgi:hypothetical protein
VWRAAGRYIAAYEPERLHGSAPPPPLSQTGARLILFVPPDQGPRQVLPR